MSGYRFVLELPDGDVVDPAMFVTAIPSWREGDEFLAGRELQRFHILSIHAELDLPDVAAELRIEERELEAGGGGN